MSKYNLPRFSGYGEYAGSNYGVNALVFCISGIDFYFSYKTLVAIRDRNGKLFCIKNYWKQTTGKHLNWIQPDHSKRLDQDSFDKEVERIISGID